GRDEAVRGNARCSGLRVVVEGEEVETIVGPGCLFRRNGPPGMGGGDGVKEPIQTRLIRGQGGQTGRGFAARMMLREKLCLERKIIPGDRGTQVAHSLGLALALEGAEGFLDFGAAIQVSAVDTQRSIAQQWNGERCVVPLEQELAVSGQKRAPVERLASSG